jgi:hypothetical protein
MYWLGIPALNAAAQPSRAKRASAGAALLNVLPMSLADALNLFAL